MITIGDTGYIITADEHCFALGKLRAPLPADRKPGEKIADCVGFYRTLDGALVGLAESMLRSKAQAYEMSLEETMDAYRDIALQIKAIAKGS